MFWGSNFTFTFANVIKCWQCNSRFQSFSVQLKFHFHMAESGQFHMHQVVNVRPLCKSQSTILQTQLTKWMFDQRAREWTSHTEKVAQLGQNWVDELDKSCVCSPQSSFSEQLSNYSEYWTIIWSPEELWWLCRKLAHVVTFGDGSVRC